MNANIKGMDNLRLSMKIKSKYRRKTSSLYDQLFKIKSRNASIGT